MSVYRELLIGCGYRRARLIDPYDYSHAGVLRQPIGLQRWQHVTAVDLNPACQPDYVMDLEKGLETTQKPLANDVDIFRSIGDVYWQLRDNVFDEVHAYEILEHLGTQGNATEFFGDFDELWRVLRPGGYLCASVPSRFSGWFWGDPGHRRGILPETILFLNRPRYDQWVGNSPSSDYRPMFVGDWDIVYSHDDEVHHNFVLQAVKPARLPQGMPV